MANVLITGTSTGIGEASARLLAERGWTVYAGVRRDEDGDRLKTELTGDVRPVILDVGKQADVVRVIADIARDAGPAGLQGLVNNAGIGVGGPFEYLDEDDWRWVFEINFFAIIGLTKAALPLLRDGRGRIVHIGSVGGRIASPGLGPYAASKYALGALAESQRAELAGFRIADPRVVHRARRGQDRDLGQGRRVPTRSRRGSTPTAGSATSGSSTCPAGSSTRAAPRGSAPVKVAEVIEHALTADRPKARYLVGQDAKVAGHVLTRLPDRARDAAGRLGSKRWETRGRKLRGAG